MRTRLKDVANALGISISTVNAALQNRADISVTTRERVAKKARELGYRTNWVARSLVVQRTQVLGVVFPDISHNFFAQIAKGIDAVTSAAGYHLLISNTAEDPRRENDEISTLIDRQVDGLIIASTHPAGEASVWKNLEKFGVPFVLIDRLFPGTHSVGGNDKKMGFLATQHLIDQGYRRIAHVRGPDISTANDRFEGYTKALRANSMSVKRNYIVESPYHAESGGSRAAEALLKLPSPPDAIFAASDPIAVGVLAELRRRSITGIGVIGVGNMRYGEHLSTPLSSIEQHPHEVGSKAASLVLELLDGKKTPKKRPLLIEPTLVVRASSQRKAPKG